MSCGSFPNCHVFLMFSDVSHYTSICDDLPDLPDLPVEMESLEIIWKLLFFTMFDCLRLRHFPFAETSGFASETSAVCPSVEIRIAVMPPSCNPNLAVLAEQNDTCVWPPVHSN